MVETAVDILEAIVDSTASILLQLAIDQLVTTQSPMMTWRHNVLTVNVNALTVLQKFLEMCVWGKTN